MPDAGKSPSPHHSLLVTANQAAVINAAKSASATASGVGGGLSKLAVATLVKSGGGAAAVPKGLVSIPGGTTVAAKGHGNVPVVSVAKSGMLGSVVTAAKSGSAGSLVGGAGGSKTGTAQPPVGKVSVGK